MTYHFRLGYRADIEGLRAIAILLVVAAHAQISPLAGGFVGVDVFFVLSGYLISGLLLQEIAQTGQVNLLQFYVRRLKRLLPALLLMLLVTSLAATIIIAPFVQQSYANTASYASLWLSNVYFAFAKLNYFDANLNQQLHLHTWSLGVEEQFYLFWPMLVLFFLGAFAWQGAQQNHRRLWLSLGGVLVLCLLLAVFLAYTTPAWGFYLMPARAWQFALGALVLLASDGLKVKRISQVHLWLHNRLALNLLAILGLGLILSAAHLLNNNTPYPSFWALWPSLGTALLLFVGASERPPVVMQVLSLPPLQWLGTVSYSWYLWHWPVLILGHQLEQYAQSNASLLAISLLLASLSYYFVEYPLRTNRWLSQKTVVTLSSAVGLMAIAFGLTQIWQQRSQQWLMSASQQVYEQVRTDLPRLYAMGCDDWFYSAQVKLCHFGSDKATRVVVLVGDSIGAQWFPALEKLYQNDDWQLLVFTKSSCPIVDEPYFYSRIGREYYECQVWRNAVFAWIHQFKPEVVFIGSHLAGFNAQQWIKGSQRLLARISENVKQIYLLQPTLALPFDGPACLAKQQWQARWFQVADCSANVDSQRHDALRTWLQQAAESFNNVRLLDMNPVICPQNHCQAQRADQIIFRDNQHLTARYVASLSNAFIKQIQEVTIPTN